MEYFVMVARERSFTKAAEQLHITQQTLSAHISSVEKELECQLLIRRVPLELTYAGEVFLRYALGFQQSHQAMKKEFCDITANQKGILRVGVSFTRSRVIMPDLISAFQEKYPNIEITIMESSNDAMHKYLIDGEIDLAVGSFPESLPDVELRDFYQEEIVLLISKELLSGIYEEGFESKIAQGNLSALQECPFVLGNPEDIGGQIGRSMIKHSGFQPIVKAQSDNIETLLSLCVRGIGACFCPINLVQATLPAKQLSKLRMFRFDNYAAYPIRFGYQRNPYQWSIISEFIKIANQIID
ncbi:LysR family transcriptional regulator [Tissierella sp. Yu-01]|nr:LysR family transcriptional regulator [Tissierella sp. Yu-01]WFA10481.1 LysR family transcriptional regulator [Tissierella sp. Yu-01]